MKRILVYSSLFVLTAVGTAISAAHAQMIEGEETTPATTQLLDGADSVETLSPVPGAMPLSPVPENSIVPATPGPGVDSVEMDSIEMDSIEMNSFDAMPAEAPSAEDSLGEDSLLEDSLGEDSLVEEPPTDESLGEESPMPLESAPVAPTPLAPTPLAPEPLVPETLTPTPLSPEPGAPMPNAPAEALPPINDGFEGGSPEGSFEEGSPGGNSFNEDTSLGSVGDRLIGEGFTPFQLSYLAIGGGLKEAGIPGGNQLLSAYESGDLSAEDVVAAGAMTKRLGTAASDEANYTKGVDKFLRLLSRDALNN